MSNNQVQDIDLASQDYTDAEMEEDDRRWDASFAKSQEFLAQLAAEGIEEFRAGRTEPLDPDTL